MGKQSEGKRPLFAVGEVAILQSKSRPELNGERTVLLVVQHGESYICPVSGGCDMNASGALAYVLDDGERGREGHCIQWAENALRKRHQPGEHNWQDLMTVLHLPVSRSQLARLELAQSGGRP
nr:hypothetical protein [uncultured Pseudomonas sp.]